MDAKDKVDLIMEIRSRLLDSSTITSIEHAEEVARRWVG